MIIIDWCWKWATPEHKTRQPIIIGKKAKLFKYQRLQKFSKWVIRGGTELLTFANKLKAVNWCWGLHKKLQPKPFVIIIHDISGLGSKDQISIFHAMLFRLSVYCGDKSTLKKIWLQTFAAICQICLKWVNYWRWKKQDEKSYKLP